MLIDSDLALASDYRVGFSTGEDKTTICLFVRGRGIELKSEEEIGIANEILADFAGLKKHIKQDVGVETLKTVSITEKQWHTISAKYAPIVSHDIRDGRDRSRYWVKIKNGRVIFMVIENMWNEREWEWILTGDESVLSELTCN